MADQDAQDINQMMSASSEAVIKPPKKSMFLWVVLGCVVVGVGLGIVVYQQSIEPAPVVKTTPKPTPVGVTTPQPTPVVPQTNVVTQPVANTMTFPESGKLRVFSDLNNLTLVITITVGSDVKTLTLPNRVVDSTKKMNYSDSSFDVTAGSKATVVAYLNKTTGPKMAGWILPSSDNKCGANGVTANDVGPQVAWAQANLATGKAIFAKQCWEDDDVPGEFNDFLLVWSYAPTTTTVSPSPSASAVVSPSPSLSPSPSPSKAASPSPSVKASSTPTPTPTLTPSPRVTMPDTSEGTPVTGVFEVTVGTVSVGLILLGLGLFGLLAL